MTARSLLLTLGLMALAGGVSPAAPLGTAFNYQGRLEQNGLPTTNGIYGMRFALHDVASGGVFLGTNLLGVPVTNGLFTATLDFGAAAFTGDARWLEIGVNTNTVSPTPGYATLLPRTRLAPTPNALYASTAGTATNVTSGAVSAPGLATPGAPANGQVLTYNGSTLTWQSVAGISGVWATNGNTAVPGSFLGTVNNLPLEVRANNTHALRLEPNVTSPNLVGGWGGNVVDAGVSGAVIAGGGTATQFGLSASNRVSDHFGTIAGGAHNLAGNPNGNLTDGYYATVGGGHYNLAVGITATIAGGAENRATNNNSSIGGGYQNVASGYISTIAGGHANQALGSRATVGGGFNNTADGASAFVGGGEGNWAFGDTSVVSGGYGCSAEDDAFVGGGRGNYAQGFLSAIPGGIQNLARGAASFAAGSSAEALHDGSFVWADQQFYTTPPFNYKEFQSTAPNQFSIRASGGMRLNTDTSMYFGNQTRQMLNLWNTNYGIGVQNFVLYARSFGGFAWHQGGRHSDAANDPGVGGTTLMTLDNNGLNVLGATTTRVLTITGGADLAEPFPMKESEIAKGSVVVIDEDHPGRLKLSTSAYDTQVAGIVSGANGIHPGIALKQEGALDQGQNVALTGRVYVKADASHGAIKPGDLLTTSDTPGHAMKVGDHTKSQGAILGKAMSALKEGTGLVLVLVTLQ